MMRGTRISVTCSRRDGWQNVGSSCANRIDVVGLDDSVEIAAGRAADGADASFCNRPKQTCAKGAEVSVDSVHEWSCVQGSVQPVM